MSRNPKLTVRAEHLLATIVARIEALPTHSDPGMDLNQKFWDLASEITGQRSGEPENAGKAYAELILAIVEKVTPSMTLADAYPIAKRILGQPPEAPPAPPPAPSPERIVEVFGRLMKQLNLSIVFDEEDHRFLVRVGHMGGRYTHGPTMVEAMASAIEVTRQSIANAREQNDKLEKMLND